MDFMRAKRSNSMSEGQFSVVSRLVAEGMGISPVGQARACSQAMPTGLRPNATAGAEHPHALDAMIVRIEKAVRAVAGQQGNAQRQYCDIIISLSF